MDDGRLHAVHVLQPAHRRSRSRSTPAAPAATARPTSNLDTFDPERKDVYESYNFESRWRIPGGGQICGGVAIERERIKNCTSPDDPNYGGNGKALCDDFALDIPYRPQFKMSGTKEIGYGINVSMSFQNNSSPTSSRVMTATRGSHALPGQLPVALPGRRDHHADRHRSARRR